MRISRAAGAIGAEVQGVRLSVPLAETGVAELRDALLEHLVLFFRDQPLDPQQLLAFSVCFGEPSEYPQVPGLPESPFITSVTKLEEETVNFGGVWHSDTTYLERPPMASILYAVEIPPYGGDTIFANQYLAYDSLTDGLKRMLGGMSAVSSSTKINGARTRANRQRDSGAKQQLLETPHPVVRTHPETGRKGLYVNRGHTTHFDGWTVEESEPLLNYLFNHQVKPEFSWQKGSLAFWDNRCCQHYPVNDYQGFKRVMHRLTLAGDRPR